MTRTLMTGLWLAATAMMAAALFAAGQEDLAKGEKIVNTTCLSCHDLRPIQTQALDGDEWSEVVSSMVDKGAKVDKEDIPHLIAYLADEFGPMPEGDGKQIVLNKCTVCHDLKRVRQHYATPEEWADTLGAMENEGLIISSEEFVSVLRYLARNFRP
jgi:cytochrome c5